MRMLREYSVLELLKFPEPFTKIFRKLMQIVEVATDLSAVTIVLDFVYFSQIREAREFDPIFQVVLILFLIHMILITFAFTLRKEFIRLICEAKITDKKENIIKPIRTLMLIIAVIGFLSFFTNAMILSMFF